MKPKLAAVCTDKREWYRNVYLKSEHWQIVRHLKLCSTPKCEKCGEGGCLDVHHLDYRNVYNIRFQDLQTLCRRCHRKAHQDLEAFKTGQPKAIDILYVRNYNPANASYSGLFHAKLKEGRESGFQTKEEVEAFCRTVVEFPLPLQNKLMRKICKKVLAPILD